jgi:riboflavin synthase
VFTGIIEELGRFARRDGGRFRFEAARVLDDVHLGDSIAVNGCCLTVVAWGEGWWEADVSDETLSRTNLGAMSAGDPVNLERPVRLSDRLGGHQVLGHVDTVGTVVRPAPDLRVRIPAEWMRYVVEKGSIAVDGISLTAFNLTGDTFDVAIIPHTREVTTLKVRGDGSLVNIEVDVMAKHLERLVAPLLPRPAGE